MRTVHLDPAIGLACQMLILAGLAGTVGLSGAGWLVGVASAALVSTLLARGLARYGSGRLGPADWVTLARVTLAVGVAALTADSSQRPPAITALVSLTGVALVLDAADGWVARRTRTASTLGAIFDGEADAFLILVLSVFVARAAGAWVLGIGAARYGFLAAGRMLPWMRRTLPQRYWRKVVTGAVGVILLSAAWGALPRFLTNAALVVASALIAESFGRDAWWLWRRRRDGRDLSETRVTAPAAGRPRAHAGSEGLRPELAGAVAEQRPGSAPDGAPDG